jgi:arsenate reductase
LSGIRKILFVCVGNTCRSQMAEGFARYHGAGRVEVRSAGTSAAGFLNATTIEVMRERGIDITGQTSDQLTDEMLAWADVVVTMGCCSADDICPVSFSGEKQDWPIEDPLGIPIEDTRRIRDEIEKRVMELIGHE